MPGQKDINTSGKNIDSHQNKSTNTPNTESSKSQQLRKWLEEKNGVVLIDKAKLSNVTVESVKDASFLVAHGNMTLPAPGDNNFVVSADGCTFKKLEIEISDCASLLVKADYNPREDKTFVSSALGLCVIPDPDYGNTVCDDVSSFLARIYYATQEIMTQYGVMISTEDSTITSIEINKTFELAYNYSSYRRPIEYMLASISPVFKRLHTDCYRATDDHTYIASTKKKNNSRAYTELKIYNKGEQFDLKFPCMRVEITFIGAQTVARHLGSNKLLALSDTAIYNAYQKLIDKRIIRPLKKANALKNKQLLQILHNNYDNHQRMWVHKTLAEALDREACTGVPFILSIQDVITLLDRIKPALTAKHLWDLRNRMLHKDEYHDTFSCLYTNDEIKLQELLDKLTSKDGGDAHDPS